ncbi:PREDICTED: gem-associated protein 7 [Pseudopodoces humilis]|uniref:gem-associated protein 7 n=1 Tax=Pseudopodoces humilis TaxID=181119 RepID=UPI0003955D9B|nr:PREDICTED: gem-associated protein 7 [Pseudopodoces humilis]XP_014118269.1 PREDICTED: gem-associated protein 7 [Pseudopodoces humilis]XP_014118270.1 PREDICTED: gem-associated protein 7 [Pseudopodoces humilis]
MADPIPVPVGILRLPRGPDSSGARGFSRDWRHSRDAEDSRDNNSRDNSRDFGAVQRARAALRERFLRLLGSARGRRTRFSLWSGILLDAEFGAADVESGAFQVDSLQTPLGIQGSALLRSGDVLEFSFPLE